MSLKASISKEDEVLVPWRRLGADRSLFWSSPEELPLRMVIATVLKAGRSRPLLALLEEYGAEKIRRYLDVLAGSGEIKEEIRHYVEDIIEMWEAEKNMAKIFVPKTGWNVVKRALSRLSELLELSFLFENALLVGGTALGLQVGHRVSYDLDFAWVGSKKLPWRRLLPLLEEGFRKLGYKARRVHKAEADMELADAGFYPEEQYLLFLLEDQEGEEVKFEVWVPDSAPFWRALEGCSSIGFGRSPVRMAPPEAIFDLKALVLPRRLTWRDLYDLWFLVGDSRFPDCTCGRIVRVLEENYSDVTVDSVLVRLKGLKPERLGDQGFRLADGSMPDWGRLFVEFRKFAIDLEAAWRKRLQKKVRKARQPGPKL